jgi:hypothetical protein
MSQTAQGYHSQAIMKNDTAQAPLTKDNYLNRLLEKQSEFHLSIAREAIAEMTDKFIEGVVYHGAPLVGSNVSFVL